MCESGLIQVSTTSQNVLRSTKRPAHPCAREKTFPSYYCQNKIPASMRVWEGNPPVKAMPIEHHVTLSLFYRVLSFSMSTCLFQEQRILTSVVKLAWSELSRCSKSLPLTFLVDDFGAFAEELLYTEGSIAPLRCQGAHEVSNKHSNRASTTNSCDNSLDGIVDKRVHDRHGFLRHSGVAIHFPQSVTYIVLSNFPVISLLSLRTLLSKSEFVESCRGHLQTITSSHRRPAY